MIRARAAGVTAQLTACGPSGSCRPTLSVPRSSAAGFDLGDTKYGWAVQGGLKFNAGNWLAAGDTLYLQAAYAEGAASYIGTNRVTASRATAPLNFLVVSRRDCGAVLLLELKLGQGYNVLAAFDHYWTPSFDTAIWASYTRWEQNNGALTGAVLGAPSSSTVRPGPRLRDLAGWRSGDLGSR